MNKLILLAFALFGASLAHSQSVYSVSNSACAGTPLVCDFTVQQSLVRPIASFTLTFNAGQSPASQNKAPFTVFQQYGPGVGSNVTYKPTATWGYQVGGFYDVIFSTITGQKVALTFKQASDLDLGTFWSVVGKQDAVIGADLTQAY